ncbi:flavodoxin domain-containing protein [Haloplasma contractile]|uniref:Protoporphyrinogen oxidase protein n=1 Tax=Haloplasma contractile SSD-17B TaxID=1033810 RepID=U2FLB5_9MOLU|nr:flavodoxin domain-containing protein [Haloplasma contractile]ERJ11989.1 protoporphyrinogen oxidase protein [Haloplasma contractile SSD-17B]
MKILIVYATKYGSTTKATLKLKEALNEEVSIVNIMENSLLPKLQNYDCVILGGSIYMGKIQKQIRNYVDANLSQLMTKRIGLFICAGSPNKSDREQEFVNAFPKKLYDHAVCKSLFGYQIDYEKMKWHDKFIMRIVSKSKESVFELSEEVIEQFAKTIKSS